MLILAGRYGDRVGRRRTSVIGLVVIVLGSLVCAFAPTFTVLIVGRVIEGIGMGILFSGLLALIADAVPRELIGRAFGLWAFIGALSVLLSPVIGGALAEVASWRWIFGVNALIAIAALVAARRVILPVTAPSPSRSLQHAALFRIRSYVAGTVVVSLVYFTFSLTWLALVFYVGAVHNLGPTMTGLAFVLYGVWWLVLPPFTGRLADRIGVRLPMLWGSTVGAIGFIVLAFASSAENLVLLGLGL
jgi:MFS family permease